MSRLEEIISDAETKIREIEGKIRKLEGELQFERRLLSRLREANAPPTALTAGLLDMALSNAKRNSIPSRIEEILSKENRPIHVNEIIQRLEVDGVRTDSERGIGPSVMSALSRGKDKFERVGQGMYRLVTAA